MAWGRAGAVVAAVDPHRGRPSRLAGTWSWNRLWATCSSSARSTPSLGSVVSRAAAGYEHGADDNGGGCDLGQHGGQVGLQDPGAVAEAVLQLTHPARGDVEDGDVAAHANRQGRGFELVGRRSPPPPSHSNTSPDPLRASCGPAPKSHEDGGRVLAASCSQAGSSWYFMVVPGCFGVDVPVRPGGPDPPPGERGGRMGLRRSMWRVPQWMRPGSAYPGGGPAERKVAPTSGRIGHGSEAGGLCDADLRRPRPFDTVSELVGNADVHFVCVGNLSAGPAGLIASL